MVTFFNFRLNVFYIYGLYGAAAALLHNSVWLFYHEHKRAGRILIVTKVEQYVRERNDRLQLIENTQSKKQHRCMSVTSA